MPIYEYRCLDCGKQFQRLQPMGSGTDGVSCPECESSRIERQISCFASTTAGTAPSAAPPCGGGGG
jgi:putative FmdB family regulatory protein